MADQPSLSLTPSQLRPVLVNFINARIPLLIEGNPGIGKSSIIAQVCAEELGGIECRNWMRGSHMDPVDLKGGYIPPKDENDTVHWAVPDFFPTDPDSRGVLFWDEIGQAPPSVQAGMMQWVLENRSGQRELPLGWAQVAATNLETDRSGVAKMLAALSLRFTRVRLVPDVNDWCKRMLAEDTVLPEIVAFIRFRPELLHQFDPKLASSPNPRSWERVSKIVQMGFEPHTEMVTIAGTVGEGAAIECMAFLKIARSLPSVDTIMMSPLSAPVPDEPSARFALCGALARRATERNFQAVLDYSERVGTEFNWLTVQDAVARDGALQATKAFVNWSCDHQALLQ